MATEIRRTVVVDDAKLDVATWVGDAPGCELVLLHDGLGSISQWREVPSKLAVATGRTAIAYDRPGHGVSTPVPNGPWPADWLHQEADRFARFLDVLELERPIVIGHSDGGSIAALLAADQPNRVSAVVLLAAHSWVEPMTRDEIKRLRSKTERVVASLLPFHAHAEQIFEAWSGVWVGTEFASWDIRASLAKVTCPTLVLQGDADEYASAAHLDQTAEAIGEHAERALLPGLGHLLHHQAPEALVRRIVEWIESSTLS